jgi:hypothetical protein
MIRKKASERTSELVVVVGKQAVLVIIKQRET